MTATRRLAAILSADVAGYSRLIGTDEEGTLERLKAARRLVIDPVIAEHHGRIVKTTGDGMLVDFASVVDALRCATEWQRGMAEHSTSAPDNRIEFRIRINVGDVVVEDGDIFGDGVNVATRLEALAEPGGICVSARVQEDAAGRLDLAFDDLGEQSLKNIARPVRVYRIRPTATESTSKPVKGAPVLALPDKPSIAVLPFANMSGEPEQEYFADGMVEEIITALSRIRWLFVIARNSSFTYKGQAVDVKRVGRELGVRYVLEGSVRKGQGRVRITAQLIETETGTHLWADHFDGLLEDVFDLQDKVAISVAGVIEPALQAAEFRKSKERPTKDLTAYDLYLRASLSYQHYERKALTEAAGLLDEATARDPGYGVALGLAVHIRVMILSAGLSDNPDRTRSEAIALARRAVQIAPDDPGALCWGGFAIGYLGEDIDAAMVLVDRSLALNPGNAQAWLRSALLRVYAGDLEGTIDRAERAMRLDPRANTYLHLTTIALAEFFDRRFDVAVPKFVTATQQAPTYTTPYHFLAASYAHTGRLAEAREVIQKLRALGAVAPPPVGQWRKPAHRELLLSGLLRAASEST